MFANPDPSRWSPVNLSPSEGFGRSLNWVTWLILVCALGLAIHASIELRGLYADGAHHLMLIIESGDFAIIESARGTVHFLQQFPIVLALRFDLVDAHTAMVVYGLGVHLLPLAFVAACYCILPKDQKGYFAFPLLHYLAGTMAAGFAPVTEGAAAAAYFWLLFYLILFRADGSAMRLFTVAAALPAIFAHEAMVFLAPILAIASAWRAYHEPSRYGRALLWLLAVWFLLVVTVQIGFTLDPRDPGNKRAFAYQMRHFLWLVDGNGLNVPAALGILAGLTALAVAISVMLQPTRKRLTIRLTWLIITAFGLTSVGLAIGTAIGELALVPRVQFAARNHAAFLSFPLALVAFASVLWPPLCSLWARRRNVAILAFLAMGTFGWHFIGIRDWSDYVRIFRSVLESERGLVAAEPLLARLPPRERDILLNMGWVWTPPTMSFWLSPGGRVSTVISKYPGAGWQPFDPADPNALPKSVLFDTSAYRRAFSDCMSNEGIASPCS